MQWLLDHAGYVVPAAAFALWRIWPHAMKVWSWYRDAQKKIKQTDIDLLDRCEKKLANAVADLQAANVEIQDRKARALELKRENDMRDDLNRQDRIAKGIYLKHIRELGGDVVMVESEVSEAVRKVIGDGYTSRSD